MAELASDELSTMNDTKKHDLCNFKIKHINKTKKYLHLFNTYLHLPA